MQADRQVSPVGSASLDQHGRSLIQHIDDFLLNPLIELIVQRVDPHNVIENLFILFADIRHRKGNDRKASFLPGDIFILQHTRFQRILHRKLLLFLRQPAGRLLALWHEGFLTEDFHHSRPAVHCRLRLVLFKGIPHELQFALHKKFIQNQRYILPMVVIELFIGIRPEVSVLIDTPSLEDITSRPINRRAKTNSVKIKDCLPDHPFKAEAVP